MYQEAMETINQGIELVKSAITDIEKQHSEQMAAAEAAISAAQEDKAAQQRGMMNRIAELQAEAASKEAECNSIAADMSNAYGQGDTAKADELEQQLDQLQEAKNNLDKKIERMKNTSVEARISDHLVKAARESIKVLIESSGAAANEMMSITAHIEKIIEPLEEIIMNSERTSGIIRRSGKDSNMIEALIKIVENNEGPLDVTYHSCGTEREAKLRYCTHGIAAPGLEKTPLIKGLTTVI